MKKNIFIPFLFLIFMGVLPVSCDIFCNRDSCGCGPIPGARDFRIKSLRLETVALDNQEYQETKAYEYNKVGISIDIGEYEYVSLHNNGNNNWFVSSAMACDPVPPRAIEKISEISITAESSFAYAAGQIFNAGEDISELFTINSLAFSSFTAMERPLYMGESIFIKLVNSPYNSTSMQFSIKVVLDNNNEQVFSDVKLKIK